MKKRYLCAYSDSDDWTEVEAYSEDQAAESFAELVDQGDVVHVQVVVINDVKIFKCTSYSTCVDLEPCEYKTEYEAEEVKNEPSNKS